MQRHLFASSALALALLAGPAAAEEAAPFVDLIVVTGSRATPATDIVATDDVPVQGPDATSLMTRVPGGARVGNGALSGQVQYRGLFGPRLNLRVDGQRFASGGPNLMDPPFHYAPAPLVAALEVDRGVSPVRTGPGLGGGVNAVLKRIEFADTAQLRLGYDLSAEGRSVDDSYAAGGVIGVATDRFRLNLLGSYERGEDTKFPGGRIDASRFERTVYGLSAGARIGAGHSIGLDLRRQHTGPSGNPPFPMDIRYFDTDTARLTWRREGERLSLDAAVGYAEVAHAMNNYDLRPAPAARDQRETFAYARTWTAEAALETPLAGGRLRAGADLEQVDKDVVITNPFVPGFVINTMSDVALDRAGVFTEWTGDAGWAMAELGVRLDRHAAKAGAVATGPAVPNGPAMLARAFNASDRSRHDTTADMVARVWTPAERGLSWRVTLARKTRVAGYVERYGWLPTSASGGLADGNIYVGDRNLKPEVAWIAEAGFDYRNDQAYLRPTLFIREVDDFIQGVPFDATPGVLDTPQEMVAAMSGDATPLRFANVDARVWGVDLDAGLRLSERWRVDAVASWVRGRRRDVDDNLYRIVPPSLTVGLTHERQAWSATLETRLVASQTHVSRTNSEARTGGYGVVNLYGAWTVREGARLSAGIENLLDNRYADHLGGYNQVSGSDVGLGARLPGPGRGAFVRLSVSR